MKLPQIEVTFVGALLIIGTLIAAVCGCEPHVFVVVSERVLHLCGSHLHPAETGRVLHDGRLRPHPAHRSSLLAFLLDQPGRQRGQSAPG